jgi:hypothetical protein
MAITVLALPRAAGSGVPAALFESASAKTPRKGYRERPPPNKSPNISPSRDVVPCLITQRRLKEIPTICRGLAILVGHRSSASDRQNVHGKEGVVGSSPTLGFLV